MDNAKVAKIQSGHEYGSAEQEVEGGTLMNFASEDPNGRKR